MSHNSRTSVTRQVEFLKRIPCEKLKYRYNMEEPLKFKLSWDMYLLFLAKGLGIVYWNIVL